jgi:hypothetical protein
MSIPTALFGVGLQVAIIILTDTYTVFISEISGDIWDQIPVNTCANHYPLMSFSDSYFFILYHDLDRLCGLVVRVLGYRSGGLGSIPGTTRGKKKSSGSGTGSTQPREYN